METASLEPPVSENEVPAKIPLFSRKESVAYRITSANAAEFSRKAWQARRERAAKQAAAVAFQANALPEAVEVAKELRRIKDLIADESDPDSLQKLTASHSRLFATWQVLTGTPNPGSAKSRVKRGNGHLSEVQPLSDVQPVANQPVPQASSNPDLVTISKSDLQAMITAAVTAALQANKTVT